MRINLQSRQLSRAAREAILVTWHYKILWLPRRIGSQIVWMELVERRGERERCIMTNKFGMRAVVTRWKWSYKLLP